MSQFDPSDRVAAVPPSGIRKYFELAEEADDVISLGVGEPDFSAPWAAREAAIDSLERGKTSYTANRGLKALREAIAADVAEWGLDYDPAEEIVVTAGASEAVDAAMRAFVDPGDRVAVHEPTYISYRPTITFAGGEPLAVSTTPETDFVLTPEALREAGADEAELLVLCYPNNPTGATASREQLARIAAFCREHDLLVVADEIYASLTYEGDHTSIASLPGMSERTVVVNGFSKAYAMTGLRLGYALGPPDAMRAVNRIHQYGMLSAPTTAQYAAVEAIESCDDDLAAMRDAFDRRRRFVVSRFREIGMDCFEATGAFYAFPEIPDSFPGDDEDFAEGLLEAESVALVPGSVFGEGGRGHLRVSYATGMSELKEALARIERFVGAQSSASSGASSSVSRSR